MKAKISYGFIITVFVFFSACSDQETEHKNIETESPLNFIDTSCDDEKNVLISKNINKGRVCIGFEAIDQFAEKIPKEDVAGFFNSPTRIENLLNNLLTDKILLKEAKSKGLIDTSKDKEILLDGTGTKAYQKWFSNKLEMPNFETLANERYLLSANEYKESQSHDIKHLLIRNESRSDEEAMNLAVKILEEINSGAISFDKAVSKYSEDEITLQNKGLIEGIVKGQTDIAFEEAMIDLKQEEISEPIKTKFGVHIIQCVAIHPERQKSFNEVRSSLIDSLRSDYQSSAWKAELARLTEGGVEPNPDNIFKLRTRYMSEKERADFEVRISE